MLRAIWLLAAFFLSFMSFAGPVKAAQINPNNYNIYRGDLNGDGASDFYFARKPAFIILHGDIAIPLMVSVPGESFVVYRDGSGYATPQLLELSSSDIQQKVSADILALASQNTDYLIWDQNTSTANIILRGADWSAPALFLSSNSQTALPIVSKVLNVANYPGISSPTVPWHLEDVDKDGRLDLVIGNADNKSYGQVAYLGDSYGAPITAFVLTPTPNTGGVGTLIGAMQGAFKVDEGGTANYNIPISVPVGTAGVDPELAVTYSSQGGNGVVGVGGAISGISAISRCRQTLLQDNNPLPLQLNSSDRFCLNGQRLMLISGTYGGANSTYKTEVDSYVLITAYGGTSGNPDYFTVEAKDGSVTTFGGSASSKLFVTNATMMWAISRFEDSMRNRIDYTYTGDRLTTHRIAQIDYAYPAAGSSSNPGAHVEFAYSDRADVSLTTVPDGRVIKQSKLLNSITSYNGSSIFRKYNLYYNETSYTSADNLARLTSAEECTSSASTSCYPRTKFTWGYKSLGFASTGLWFNKLPSASKFKTYSFFDYNGDGRQDVVWVRGSGKSRYIEYASLNGPSAGMTKQTFSNGVDNIPYTLMEDSDEADLALQVLDYNGDGRQDLAVCLPENRYGYNCVNWKLYLSVTNSSGGWSLSASAITLPFTNRYVAFGDINSDGLLDAVAFGSTVSIYTLKKKAGASITSNQYYEFSNTPQNIALSGVPELAQATTNNSRDPIWQRTLGFKYATLGDIDGDGRMDIIVPTKIWKDPCNIYSTAPDCDQQRLELYTFINKGSSFQFSTTYNDTLAGSGITNWPDIMTATKIQIVDFNGDGYTDIAWGDWINWSYKVNSGSNFGGYGRLTDISSSADSVSGVSFVDYNRDGYLDVIWHDKKNKQLKWRKWIPESASFETSDRVLLTNKPATRTYSFSDITGDGFADMVEQKYDDENNIDIGVYAGNGSASGLDKMYTITDGNGVQTQIKYGSLANSNNYTTLAGVNTSSATDNSYCNSWSYPGPCYAPTVYTFNVAGFYSLINQPFGSDFAAQNASPILELAGPMYVVTSVTGSAPSVDDPNNTSTISYHYHHARIQPGGHGFLGFEKLTAIDNQTGVRTETSYHQDWPLVGRPTSTQVVSKDGKLLSESASTWQVATDSANAKVTRVNLDTTTDKSYALKDDGASQGGLLQTTTTDNEFDEYGNSTNIVSVVTGSGNTITKTTVNEYWSSAWEKRMGRLKTVTTTTQKNSEAAVVRNTSYEYYGQSDSWPGLLKKETIEPDANELTIEYGYDAVGNQITTTKTAEVTPGVNQTRSTRTEFDANHRFAQTTYDSYNNVVSGVLSRHSIFGGPTKVRDVNGVVTRIDYDQEGNEVQRSDDTGAWKYTKKLRCTEAGANCPSAAKYKVETYVSGGGKSFEYVDLLGRVVRAGKVMFDGRESLVDTEYDNMGRVKRKSEPYYSGETQYWSSFEYDLLGRVIKLTAPDGTQSTTTYDGYKTTLVANASDTSKKLTKVEERDGLGNLVKVTDNLQGTISYAYDVMGHMVTSTTQASGKTVTVKICYDSLGRKIAMHDPDKGGFLGNANASCEQVANYLDTPAKDKLTGWWFYKYNDFGDLIEQTDPKKQVSTMEYDALGRMVDRTDYYASAAVDTHTHWYFDKPYGATAALTKTQLKLTAVVESFGVINNDCSGANYCQTYEYDDKSRVTDTITYLPNDDTGYHQSIEFDAIGRPVVQRDVLNDLLSGQSGTRNYYNTYGYATQINDLATGDVLQKTLSVNARGQVLTETRNNGAAGQVTNTYDPETGRLANQYVSVLGALVQIQNVTYQWDVLGNLKSRLNQSANLAGSANKNLKESFCYDGLNRLIKSYADTLAGACNISESSQDVKYDGLGNITWKKELGSYSYSGKGPHAVTSTSNGGSYTYDNNGNLVSDAARSITYSSYDQPLRITKSGNSVDFKYGPDRARFERVDNISNKITKTHYLGNIERIENQGSGVVEWKRYIGGAIYTVRTTATTTNGSVSYSLQKTDKSFVYNDHLGSLDVVVNALGKVTHSASFDAWGNRRSGENWTQAFSASSLVLSGYDQQITRRGFTNHEMLDDFGLIHMNGRIYDPRLSRFLQADPMIQAASNIQSYNRYSYVWNNPLNATDPSGYLLVETAMAFGIGQWTNKHVVHPFFRHIGYQNSQTLVSIGSLFCGPYAALCAAAGTYEVNKAFGASNSDAFFAGVFAGVSTIAMQFAGSSFNNIYANALAAGFVGGVLAELQGGNFGNGFLSAGLGSLSGSLGLGGDSLLGNMVVGGTISRMTGGKFANGAISAAFGWAKQQGYLEFGKGGVQNAPQSSGGGGAESEEKLLQDTLNKMSESERVKVSVVRGDGRVDINVTGTVESMTETDANDFILGVNKYWNNISRTGSDGIVYTLSVKLESSMFGGGFKLEMNESPPTKNGTLGFRSHVQGRVMRLWRSDPQFNATASHEFGHILGFGDQYRDVAGGGSVALPGHGQDLMGTGYNIEAYHLRALAAMYGH